MAGARHDEAFGAELALERVRDGGVGGSGEVARRRGRPRPVAAHHELREAGRSELRERRGRLPGRPLAGRRLQRPPVPALEPVAGRPVEAPGGQEVGVERQRVGVAREDLREPPAERAHGRVVRRQRERGRLDDREREDTVRALRRRVEAADAAVGVPDEVRGLGEQRARGRGRRARSRRARPGRGSARTRGGARSRAGTPRRGGAASPRSRPGATKLPWTRRTGSPSPSHSTCSGGGTGASSHARAPAWAVAVPRPSVTLGARGRAGPGCARSRARRAWQRRSRT